MDFRRETRRLLFNDLQSQQEIPGAGTSASDSSGRHVRVKVTINLDEEVVTHFKEQAREEGRPYQSLINQVLREHIKGSHPEQLANEIKNSLLEDSDFLQSLSEKIANLGRK